MPRKRSHRERKRAQEKKRQGPPHQLLQQGRQKLDEGDPRQALAYFKQAQREDNGLKGLNVLFFRAYSLRARQLLAKDMAKEAAVMRTLAQEQQATIDPQALTADDLLRYLRQIETPEAVAVYASCLHREEISGEMGQILADHLVVDRRWEALDRLDEDHPLRRDADIVKQALNGMDDGAWEQAWAELAGVSRRSPYAHWRLFCKAMASFQAKDDGALEQALALLPKDFVLSHVVDELRRVCSPAARVGGKTTQPQARQALGTDTADVEQLAAEFVAALKHRPMRSREVETLLKALAQAIYPEDPIEACVALLEIMGIAARRDGLPMAGVLAMQRLLPQDRARVVVARIELINQETSHHTWNVAPAVAYLANLGVEFPEARQQALARARALEFLARSGQKGGVCTYCVGPQVIETLWKIIGERSGDREMIFADLMLASLAADPDNREGYRFLIDLLQGGASAKPKIEKALNEMASRFPDDPSPCLELALLHYSKNAYRRAEAALEEARRRAPYDDRILDSQAIGYLKSADQGRSRKNYRLAEQDLQRAQDLGRRRVAPILLVKRLGLKLMASGPEALAEIEPTLDSLAPPDQLRSLALLVLDLSDERNLEPGTLDKLEEMLDRKKDLLEQLSGEEVVALVAPIDPDFKLIFRGLQVAPALADRWVDLMRRADGDDLIAFFDILMGCQSRNVVEDEIKRRLAGMQNSDCDPLLLFYLAVIRRSQGGIYGAQDFTEILDAADSVLKERLRAAAARLAPYTHGPLREALQRFDFSILELSSPFIGAGPPGLEQLLEDLAKIVGDDDNLFDYDDDDDDDELDDDLSDLDELESMFDDLGLRGAPLDTLREFVMYMRSDSERRRDLDRIAHAVRDRYDELSRELRVLLFPKRRGTRQQTR